jgi:hypothetical protein
VRATADIEATLETEGRLAVREAVKFTPPSVDETPVASAVEEA